MISFKEFFSTKKIILFDGATGSNLLSHDNSLPLPDLLSLKRPELVGSLHEAYLKAGCDVIETNSFNSNPLSFENFGIEENAFKCAKKAAEIAKKAAERFSTDERPRFVAGSIGPIFDKNGLLQDERLLSEAFSAQISALSEGGADLLIFETMQDTLQLNSAFAAAEKIRKDDIPAIVSISGKNGITHTGTPFEEIVREMSKHDIFALGLNCEDFSTITEDIEIIKKVSDLPLVVMPNLGLSEKIEGKFFYKTTPAGFAGKMSEIIRRYDPKIIGGCCGTTPLHIKALASEIFG
ncbi:homocysteine S-methyltransferase family protein [bacterium]|nr:homocysteine S-methyltransferase family protein [bacterium]